MLPQHPNCLVSLIQRRKCTDKDDKCKLRTQIAESTFPAQQQILLRTGFTVVIFQKKKVESVSDNFRHIKTEAVVLHAKMLKQ